MEVVVIKAIPKELLIHKVTHSQNVNKDRWGKSKTVKEQTLERVRMEPTNKIIRDKNNAEIQLAAIMFYDCRNSIPRGVIFAVDDIISFNGEKYRVQTTDPLYDRKKLHHYELELVKSG